MSAAAQPRQTRRRDPSRRIAVLGVATVLLVLVVGYIAYTANSGLPWQSRAHYVLEVPNAERLIDSADVRMGGIRVGQVLSTTAVTTPGGRPHARVEVALEHGVGDLPADSTVQVRPASVLGLTYVDLVRGTSARTIPEGGTIPVARAQASTNLTDLFEVFDRSSARRFQRALEEISGGLAGRGTALNAATASVSRLLEPLGRVADSLAAPAAQLSAFLSAADTVSAALAPVSDELAGLFAGAATTFDAMSDERAAIGDSLAVAPSTETAVTRAFTVARPAVDGLAELTVDLRPAARALPATLAQINPTLRAGLAPLRALPSLQPPLRTALVALDGLSRDANTTGSLRKLRDLAAATIVATSTLVPGQVHCNALSLFTQGFAGTFGTLGTGQGPALAALFLATNGAQNEGFQNSAPSANVGMNPLPTLSDKECESGNEPWSGKQQLGNPPGLQSRTTRPTVPPPGTLERARSAGLLTDPEGLP